ncbi:unnamed protein product [Prorocentrum cordatum]|uniref:J domain-containing protein n=1 Tax=Prorocentrum cordatum TaxID=2364126 RepID=A0ABN9V8R7_9DINO|nr:unnamed protein product [Polarella glacialis]
MEASSGDGECVPAPLVEVVRTVDCVERFATLVSVNRAGVDEDTTLPQLSRDAAFKGSQVKATLEASSKPRGRRKNRSSDPRSEESRGESRHAEEEDQLTRKRKKKRPSPRVVEHMSECRHKTADRREAKSLSIEDHLEILGLPPDAGAADIRRQYYIAIKRTAGDTTGLSKTLADAQFQQIQKSYRVLMAHFQKGRL